MRRSGRENSSGAEEGRGINAHPKYKNLGGETLKKRLAVILSAVLVISMMTMMPAIASDWPEFQVNETNIGRTDDSAPITAPNATVSWNHHTAHAGWSGIDTVPIVVGDYVYVLATDSSNAKLFKYYKNGTAAGGSWPVNVGSSGFQNSCPAYGNNTIFVANAKDKKLYGVNATSGAKYWETAACDYQLSCPITYHNDSDDGEKGRVFFGSVHVVGSSSDAGTYYCYFDNGTQNWSRSSGCGRGYYWAGAAVIGDYLVYGGDKDNLTSVYWRNGTYVDSLNISTSGGTVLDIRSSITWNESATNSNYGHIFFTNKTASGTQHAYVSKIGFNKSTDLRGHFNSSDWTSSDDIRYSTSTPAVYKGRVYVGGGNFTTGHAALLCLNESNITDKIWEYTPNGAVQSSPAISTWYDNGTNNEIYIYITTNCNQGSVYCFRDDAGNTAADEKWRYESTSSNKYMLAGAAVSGGWVFAGDDAGYLYGLANWTRYDFNVRAGTDKWAYEKQVGESPTASDPNTVFDSTGYGKIKVDDGERKESVTDTDGRYAAHRFNFSIDDNEVNFITKINVTWNGIGDHDSATDGAKLYIYNFSSTAYEQLDSSLIGPPDEITLTGEKTSSISSYINANNVTILVNQTSAQAEDGEVVSHIETDYVKLVITP